MSLSRSAASTQQMLIARLIATGATKGQIAEAAGVDGSMVSKWITDGTDPREMTFDAVRRLADVFGWDVVVGPIARASGWVISHEDAAPAADVRRASIEHVTAAAGLAAAVNAGLADGRFDAAEREDILRLSRESQRLNDAVAAIVAGRS